jgi:hypothetical protein
MRYRLRHPFHYSNSLCERVIRLKTDTPLIQWVDDEGVVLMSSLLLGGNYAAVNPPSAI